MGAELIVTKCPLCGSPDVPLAPCSKCGKRVCLNCITVITERCPAYLRVNPAVTSATEAIIAATYGRILGEVKLLCKDCLENLRSDIFYCSNCGLIHKDPEIIDITEKEVFKIAKG